jgi:hypothetical protein
VSLLITQAQKRALRELGHSDEQIREMPPAVAHRLLGLGGGVESEDTPPAEPAAVEQPSTADPARPPEKREASSGPAARPRRAKPNGSLVSKKMREAWREMHSDPDDDPDPAAGASPVLDMPEPSLIDYIEGSIAAEVRALHAANPSRSIAWIAKQSGQPRSVVREILGAGEDAQ